MPLPEGERIAILERALHDVERELEEVKNELARSRSRLHDLEGLVAMLVEAQKLGRREEESQYRRLEVRVQWLAVAIAFGAFALSVTLALIHH